MIKNKSIYLLVCLIEECAEVVQSACKAIRFGLEDNRPGAATTNSEDIIQEFQEVTAITQMLQADGSLPFPTNVSGVIDAKCAKVERYMELSRLNGMLGDTDVGC